MLRITAIACALATAAPVAAFAQGTVYQPGYMRRDGGYVQPHYRTAPDNSIHNNWSTRPNVNPYTGRQGTVDPYRAPSPSYGGNPYGGGRSPYGNPYRSR
jgi:hypothetical protein